MGQGSHPLFWCSVSGWWVNKVSYRSCNSNLS